MEIKAFNLTYFLFLAFILVAILFFSLYARKKSIREKKCIIFGICLFNIFLFFFKLTISVPTIKLITIISIIDSIIL